MDGTGPQPPLIDSRLERELESALGIQPSPEFLARVRARIAAEAAPSPLRWYVSMAVRRTALQPLVALAVVGVVLAVVMPGVMREGAGQPSVHVVKPPTVEREQAQHVESSRPLEQPVIAVPMHIRAREERIKEVPLRLSTPLFSEEDRRVFDQYVAAVEAGRVPPRPADPQSADSSVAQTMKIEPLMIDPLPLLAARTQTEGERKW